MSLQELKLFTNEKDYEGEDVASLPDTPSESGFDAEMLKARFDNIGKKTVEKHNALVDALTERGLAEKDVIRFGGGSERAKIELKTGEYPGLVIGYWHEEADDWAQMTLNVLENGKFGLTLGTDGGGTLPVMGVSSPTNATDAANKAYVDEAAASGKTYTDEAAANAAADAKAYTDEAAAAVKESWSGRCDTGSTAAIKRVTLHQGEGFALKPGVQVTVKFTAGNDNMQLKPQMNVADTGAKYITYRNVVLNTVEKAGYLKASGTYTFRYDDLFDDGAGAWELVGLNGSYIATGASGAEVSDLTATDCYYIDQTADWGRRATIGYSDGDSFSFHINDYDENNGSHISLHLYQSAPVGGVPSMELSTYGLNADAVLVQGVADPVNDTDAVNKRYLEQRIREVLDAMASAPKTCTLIITTNGSGAATFGEAGDSNISITYVNGSGETATATVEDATLDADDCERIVLTVACGTQFTYYSPNYVLPMYWSEDTSIPEGLEEVEAVDGDDAFYATFNVTASAGSTITLPLATNW